MNRKETGILAGLLGVLVVVFVTGEIRSKNEQKQQYQAYVNSTSSEKQRQPQPQQQPVNAGTEATDSQASSTVSAIDFLKNAAKGSGAATIVALGSSATKGAGLSNPDETWYGLLVKRLKNVEGLPGLNAYNLATTGVSTNTLLSSGVLSTAIQDKPDVILVETCAVSDWYQDVPVDTSLSNLDSIVSKLRSALPNSRVILYSPNPIRNMTTTNRLGLPYSDYLTKEQAHITGQGWAFIDIYGKMQAAVNDGTFSASMLLADSYYPNATGYSLWYKVILDGLKNTGTETSGA